MMLGLIIGIAWSICGITCFVKLDQAYEEDRKKRIFLGIFFAFFGICGLWGFFLKNNKLSLTSLMLSTALLCILLFIYAWYQVCSCKTPVTAVYLHYNEYSGGRGYADIALIPRDGKGPFAVIELKDEDADVSDEKMQNVAEEALEQIGALRYYADLHGEIHTYGIATRQTDVFIAYRKVVR